MADMTDDEFKRRFWNAFPVGTILPYAGPVFTLPDGWVRCNGDQNTANLVGRVPIGTDVIEQARTQIGSAKHTHGFTKGQATAKDTGGFGVQEAGSGWTGSAGGHAHALAGVVSDEADNMPLATLVYFIQRVK
jgi:hypothetical protein